MHRVNKALFALLILLASAAPAAQKAPAPRTTASDGIYTVTVIDLSPRFLDFYRAAKGKDPETRWRLWQERYGFAAVPPTPEGMRLARKLLEGAWERYPQILSLVERGAAALEPAPMKVLIDVATLLGLTEPFQVQVVAYVGAFDGNAFTAAQDGVITVAMPIEMDRNERELVFRHEMTHAVHIATAGLSGGWERSIAEVVFQEGLAMHATRALVPGRHERSYVEHTPGWYEAAMAKAPQILAGILRELQRSDSETVSRFTVGSGTTGIEREAYVAGWLVIGELLGQGRTFPELARVPSTQMATLVRTTIERLLAKR
ncbi:MAG: hypothetical protein L6Q72_02420 [Burkholderiaceae bacterium]|jgi:hypothetical protein|nr:hypothetical protein [Burkholderiaceae bacterium]